MYLSLRLSLSPVAWMTCTHTDRLLLREHLAEEIGAREMMRRLLLLLKPSEKVSDTRLLLLRLLCCCSCCVLLLLQRRQALRNLVDACHQPCSPLRTRGVCI
jgi:hypothetical protein